MDENRWLDVSLDAYILIAERDGLDYENIDG